MSSLWYEHHAVIKDKESFLSVVIPAKNEAASLAQLVDEITSVLRPLTQRGPRVLEAFEIVVVDDASTDSTQSVLQNWRRPIRS